MTGGALIAVGGLIVALWAIFKYAAEKVIRIDLQGQLDIAHTRLYKLVLAHSQCPGSDAVEQHVDQALDQALEVAEPTPDLKRVQ